MATCPQSALLSCYDSQHLTRTTGCLYYLFMPKLRAHSLTLLMQLLILSVSLLAIRPPAQAQGETTSAIVGSVTDPTGAAIPGAAVTVTNIENGLKRFVKTDDSGRFGFPQLKPGTYSVKAEADRFEAQRNNNVSAGLGQKQTVDFKLTIASASESILVREQAPLLNSENPNTSTTLNAQAMENLPNPGGDMTYPLQFAAGALINTAGTGNDLDRKSTRLNSSHRCISYAVF